MPPELRPQVADAAAVARAFSAAVVCVDGYEADDVIATLAARHRGEGVDVLTCVEIKIYGAEWFLTPRPSQDGRVIAEK